MSLLEYARFQSSRFKVDLGSESSGFFALGSSFTRSSSSSSFSSFFGFFSALGAGAAAGFGSFFSFGGGAYCLAFSAYSVGPNAETSDGWLATVSKWRTTLGYLARKGASMR